MKGWHRLGAWLAGSVMIFLGAAIAGLSSGEMLLFGLVIAFMLILVGGLFWMEFGNARELEERLKQ